MNLLNIARAMDDPRFKWRVNGAMFAVAAGVIGDMEKSESERAYAAVILDAPMREDSTMYALVAAYPEVSDAITVDSFNTVSTEEVEDSDIMDAVAAQWAVASGRSAARTATP